MHGSDGHGITQGFVYRQVCRGCRGCRCTLRAPGCWLVSTRMTWNIFSKVDPYKNQPLLNFTGCGKGRSNINVFIIWESQFHSLPSHQNEVARPLGLLLGRRLKLAVTVRPRKSMVEVEDDEFPFGGHKAAWLVLCHVSFWEGSSWESGGKTK